MTLQSFMDQCENLMYHEIKGWICPLNMDIYDKFGKNITPFSFFSYSPTAILFSTVEKTFSLHIIDLNFICTLLTLTFSNTISFLFLREAIVQEALCTCPSDPRTKVVQLLPFLSIRVVFAFHNLRAPVNANDSSIFYGSMRKFDVPRNKGLDLSAKHGYLRQVWKKHYTIFLFILRHGHFVFHCGKNVFNAYYRSEFHLHSAYADLQ